jgi:hypothetical protein
MIALIMKFSLRLLYLYLFSFVGLLVVVIGGIQMVNLGLKTFVLKDADRYPLYPMGIKGEPGYMSPEEQMAQQDQQVKQQRQSELSNSLAMIIIGTPLYLYHWKIIQKNS